MADYLIVTGDNPNFATRVEAKNIQAAIESLDLEGGAKVTVYRIAAPPRIVKVKEERVRRIEIGQEQ